MKNTVKNSTQTNDLLGFLQESIKGDPKELLAYKTEKVRLMLSDSIKRARSLCNITQKEMASKLDVTQSWVSKLESPNNDHTLESITQYLFTLGADLRVSINLKGMEFDIVGADCDDSMDLSLAVLPPFISISNKSIPSFDLQSIGSTFWSKSSASKQDSSDTPISPEICSQVTQKDWWKAGHAA